MPPLPLSQEPQDTSDVAMARRIAGGDRAELTRLMRKHNQRLFRTARSILKDDAEAEDAVQEGYLSAIGAMGEFRGGATLATWLVRIVANEALGRLRKRARSAVSSSIITPLKSNVLSLPLNVRNCHSCRFCRSAMV